MWRTPASFIVAARQREQARGVELGRHVGEHELDGLVLRDGDAEALALLRVGDRLLERGARDAERLRGDADAPAVERGHRDLEALADVADDRARRGDLAVLEEDRARVRGVDAELVVVRRSACSRACRVGTRNAVCLTFGPLRSVTAKTMMKSACGPLVIQFFAPLSTQPSAGLLGDRHHRLRVGAAHRLGQAEAAELLARARRA